MKIHPIVATAIVTAVFAMQAWLLMTVSHLDSDVAALKVEVHYLGGQHAVAKKTP